MKAKTICPTVYLSSLILYDVEIRAQLILDCGSYENRKATGNGKSFMFV
jgi:hypothetical protein